MAKGRGKKYTVLWVRSLAEVPQEAWDALAVPLETPLLEWAWLREMEESGSIAQEAGWLPIHLTVWSGSELIAAAPLYLKNHSMGEFVWDYVWVDLAQKLKAEYYPKLIGMSPVSPIVGYRFLMAPGEDERALTAMMIGQIDTFCQSNNIASCSFYFVDPQWQPFLDGLGYHTWRHQSYAWTNPGYQTFDDYLAVFNKNQRRNIKRERRALVDQGIRMEALTGDRISLSHLSRMFHFYEATNDNHGIWNSKYLNRRFFEGLYDRFRHRLLLMAAYDDKQEEPIGMSFLLTKGQQLLGRYWGSQGFYNALHFNACYYGPIEWAIDNGINWFDPGAGSHHKIRRGFSAVQNHSLHRFYDATLQAYMGHFVGQINEMEQGQIDALNQTLPLARGRPQPKRK